LCPDGTPAVDGICEGTFDTDVGTWMDTDSAIDCSDYPCDTAYGELLCPDGTPAVDGICEGTFDTDAETDIGTPVDSDSTAWLDTGYVEGYCEDGTPMTAEICNGLDDDCDGLVDENLEGC
jgi:hypothetical protein